MRSEEIDQNFSTFVSFVSKLSSTNMDSSLEMALAWPGFRPPPPRTDEPAGVCYEAQKIREHLLAGDDDFRSNALSAQFYERIREILKNSNVDDPSGRRRGDLLANERTALLLPDVDSRETLWLDAETESYEKYLRSLDPRSWKEQDHYKVLGLSTLRWAASDEQIRLAYRKKVLRHHPDKRRHRGEPVKAGDDDYFSCVAKAYDVLSVQQKRRAYDSVDPTFDDEIPSMTKSEKEFFELFAPAFEHNERWSKIQPVPKLGDAETPFDEVDRFYRFWYNKFDSWREFSYLDEEDKEKGENREERRWIEKQNKAAREKRRKDELKRLRTLIENGEKSDPRIQKHKDEEKKRKEDDKRAREDARRQKAEEEDARRREIEEKERKAKEEEEEAQKQQILADKREKEVRKKALQKERKALQEYMKEQNYFSPNDESARVSIMSDVDRLCQLLALERIQSLNEELRRATNGKKPKTVLDEFVGELNQQRAKSTDENEQKKSQQQADEVAGDSWTQEEQQLLVKAMTVFPVGTKSRWDVVAAFINEHRKASENGTKTAAHKTGKDVVKRVKELEKLDDSTKEKATKGQDALKISKAGAQVEAPPSVRTEAPSEIASSTTSDTRPWTAEEQKIFEQALRTYPSTLGPERWDKVAGCLPGRTKKECVKRFKELTELVRAKKAALQKVEGEQKKPGDGKK